MNAIATQPLRSAAAHLQTGLESLAQRSAQATCPQILLHLNVPVFRQLRAFQTPKRRICAVLNLSGDEYDYVDALV